MMSLVTTFYVLGYEDFHYKWFSVERLTLLIQERYEQTFSHPTWQVRKGPYRNCYLNNISCCWNSGNYLLHNKCIILVSTARTSTDNGSPFINLLSPGDGSSSFISRGVVDSSLPKIWIRRTKIWFGCTPRGDSIIAAVIIVCCC